MTIGYCNDVMDLAEIDGSPRWGGWIALAGLLALSGVLYQDNLGSPLIATWDELIHVNVVKNLAEDCCLPQLHRSDLGTDYRDWKDNSVWLHKPLLPFYVSAASYRLLGGSLWALRLPGAIFALLTAVVLFLTGRRFMTVRAGLYAAAIFSLNPYTNELVHGRELSGFPDLALAFFLSVGLYLVLDWTQTGSVATLRWLGLSLALAYLSKGGLALAPFAVVGTLAVLTRGPGGLIPILHALVTFTIVALPYRVYWLTNHPLEFRQEEHLQLLHLFTVVEGHRGPWSSYVTGYLPSILTLPFVLIAYFAILWGLLRNRPGTPGFALSLWAVAYLVPLSIAVSKIENFIFPALPAIALLIPSTFERLWTGRRLKLLVFLCMCFAAAYVLSPNTMGSLLWRYRVPSIAVSVLFIAGLVALFVTKIELRSITRNVVMLTASAVLISYAARVRVNNRFEPKEAAAKLALRQTGLDLRSLVDRNALLLVHDNSMELAYLHIMYWSGVDVLDSCQAMSSAAATAILHDRKNLYLIAADSTVSSPIARLPLGNLYSLDTASSGTWGPIVARSCQSR
jgi:4-amino-4-deoxy-L-arabinose transferase-like glycosyltransferase